MKVLVTGATGTIGPILVQRLQHGSHQVRIMTRTSPPSGLFEKLVELTLGDISDPSAVRAAVKGVENVYHLAGKLHVNNPPTEMNAEYRRINVEGTRYLVQAAQSAGVRRLIFFSTISVYGPSQYGNVLDETSSLRPQTVYAETKCEAEQIVLSAKQQNNKESLGVVLRLAAVYGPNMKGNYARLIKALDRGLFIPIGSGQNRRTLVRDQDVASAALLAAEHPSAPGQVFNVTDGHIHTFNAILNAMSHALGRCPPRYHLPARPFRLLAGVVENGFKLARKSPPVGRATVDKLLEDVAVSGEKIQRELGFRPKYDLLTSWRESVQRMAYNT